LLSRAPGNSEELFIFMTPLEQLNEIKQDAEAAINVVTTLGELNTLETEYLGRKGKLTGLLRLTGQLPPDEKPGFGQAVNTAKDALMQQISLRKSTLAAIERDKRLSADAIDVTLPGSRLPLGKQHPITQQMDAIKQALIALGFTFVETPDVEHYHYNFEMLNYPPDHPAFDEQMSFYIEDTHLLRTQTTAFQAHVMETQKPPIRVATIGKCYRFDAVDATHSHTFHQVDVLVVDEGITLADLKGTFTYLAKALFGEEVETRFRPDFFPFVEPGVEMAVRWGDRWLELGGSGLVHPNILESMGIDSEKYSGFAWGMGIDRMPMIKNRVTDLRLFTENSLAFLKQF
jgi:phenylalanyl-tRNA synthetase alpha chain